ncbi:15330_t:CDS:2, partial [Racocetra persica]
QDKEVGEEKYVLGEKLLQTLLPKKNYIIHYQALQTYMKFRMKITKIYGVLKFKQTPWIKSYIEENICKRKIAKANKDEFGFKIFEGGITAIHMLKSTVILNKPIFVGQAILDISKAMMFNFWYGYIKPRYGDKARLLYTDTDSLIM